MPSVVLESVRNVAAPAVQRLHETLFTYMVGIDARDWLELLRENRFAVDPAYWPRAALVTGASVRTSLAHAKEDRLYGPVVARTEIRPPLFILGHWRSGTTHLQRLLALDDQFAHPNLYQTTRPHTFLSTESTMARWVAFWLPKTRPMDNMPVSVDAPAEDEFALSLLTRCSPHLGWVFPRHWERYLRYLTFREVPPAELARWRSAFTWFLKKLSWRHGRPLVIKSPTHTCRIRLLLEMFPEARFIHIHRDPYAVFQSTHYMWSKLSPVLRLQEQDETLIDERVLRPYTLMYDAFFEERALIPPGRFHEVGFEDLERDPIGQLRALYETLSLAWPADFEPRLRAYLDSLRGYRKNAFSELAPSTRRQIADRWQRGFDAWGYRRNGA